MVGRVLVVDDEDTLRLTIKTRLASGGFEAEAAVDGEDALEKLKQNRFDVVLLDINMPRMDGITALGVIAEQYPQTDVIMLTGFADFTTAIECLKKGAKDYLVKPIDTTELITRMRSLLRARNSEAALDALKANQAALLLDAVAGPVLVAEHLLKELKGGGFGKLSKEQATAVAAVGEALRDVVHQTTSRIDGSILGKPMAIPEAKETPIAKVLSSAVESLGALAKASGVDVRYKAESKASRIMGDAGLLAGAFHSILAGLILNSSGDAALEVHESSSKDGVTISFQLSKTSEKARKATDHLSKTPTSLESLEPAAALWLSARNTVQRHHGTFGVESTKGSLKITCTLPVTLDKS